MASTWFITDALKARLSTFGRQKAVAFSTDFDQGEDASGMPLSR